MAKYLLMLLFSIMPFGIRRTDFLYGKLKNYRIDKEIIKKMKHFKYRIIKELSPDSICFYSIEKDGNGRFDFTVLEKSDDLGSSIYYFTTTYDKIIDNERLSGFGKEFPNVYETSSVRIGKNKFLRTSSVTEKMILNKVSRKLESSKNPVGDTIWSIITVQQDGQIDVKEMKKRINRKNGE